MSRPSSAHGELNEAGAMPCLPVLAMAQPQNESAPIANDGFDFAASCSALPSNTSVRLHPCQLPQLDVNFDATSSADFCDSSFPSSCTTSASVSQFASLLSPSIYNQLYDVGFNSAYPVDLNSTTSGLDGNDCIQNPLGLQWGFPQASFTNAFVPDYSLQSQGLLEPLVAGAIYPSVPPRIGRAHSHSLSSLTSSFTNMSTPNSVTSVSPASSNILSIATPLLAPAPRRSLRSYSSPSLKNSFSPNSMNASPAQMTIPGVGISGVDELMRITEGKTMDLVMPAGPQLVQEVALSDPAILSQGRFVTKLWRMVHHQPATDAIGWSKDGETIVVPRASDVSDQLLRLYFRHSNFSSLVRQLATYGFSKYKTSFLEGNNGNKKIPEGEWRWEFTHPCFQRGRPELLDNIKRKQAEPNPSSVGRAAADRIRAASASDAAGAYTLGHLPSHLQLERDNVVQRAQLNLLQIQRREAQDHVVALQDMSDKERGRANRLAMVAVTLMSVCSARFPDALASLPPYEEEDLVMIHSPLCEGFGAGAYDDDEDEEEENTQPPFQAGPPTALHIVTSYPEQEWQGEYQPISTTLLQPTSSNGLQTPTFGSFPDDQQASAQYASFFAQNDTLDSTVDRHLKRQRVEKPAAQAQLAYPARSRSYSTSAASRLTRTSQTFPRPVKMKRLSQSQIMMQLKSEVPQ